MYRAIGLLFKKLVSGACSTFKELKGFDGRFDIFSDQSYS